MTRSPARRNPRAHGTGYARTTEVLVFLFALFLLVACVAEEVVSCSPLAVAAANPDDCATASTCCPYDPVEVGVLVGDCFVVVEGPDGGSRTCDWDDCREVVADFVVDFCVSAYAPAPGRVTTTSP
jgi:hypothetical protein